MRLTFRVTGRPAPQGSHELGTNGYLMHSSNYLAAWRAAVNADTRRAYLEAGLTGRDMPLFPYPRPVYVTIEHIVGDEQCRAEGSIEPTGTPDVDKLARATIDGLGEARVFQNDSQVVTLTARKRRARDGEVPGAAIEVTDEISKLPTAGEIYIMSTFKPTGRYRLVLEEVGVDEDGDRTWETVVEATDTPERLLAAWLPAIGVTLGDSPAAPAPVAEPVAAAPAEPAARKPRAKKAAPPPVVVEQAAPAAPVSEPVAAPQAAPVAQPVEAAPAPQAAAQPVAADPQQPARVNPFARP